MVPLERVGDASIERDLLAELRATVQALALLRQLLSQAGGDRSIVVMTSINGLGASAGAALYSASKAAATSWQRRRRWSTPGAAFA
jgi:NAD(P)-dependent dehydrogenase (short-subunit alcohol dehydrogenase family)